MCVELSSTSNIIISYNFPFLEAVVPTQVSSTIFHNWANRNHFSIHCVLVSAEVKEKTQHVSMQRPCSAISIGAPSNRLNPLKGGKGSLQSPWKWNLLKNHCTFLCIFFFRHQLPLISMCLCFNIRVDCQDHLICSFPERERTSH